MKLYLPYLELTARSRHRSAGYHLPSLQLTAEDFTILRRAAERTLALGSTPLAASATSALRKLSFDLPGLAGAPLDEVALAAPVPDGFTTVFAVLRSGVEQRRAVRCQYYAISRDQEDERVIEPYGVMLSWGTWYCIARARDRDAIRVFRIDRMRAATLIQDDTRFTVPADFSVQGYLDRAPWELSEAAPTMAQVRIAFPHARWVIAEGLGVVVDAVDDRGGAVLEFAVRSMEPFVRWLLPFGNQVQVLSPSDLATRLTDERARVRALYA